MTLHIGLDCHHFLRAQVVNVVCECHTSLAHDFLLLFQATFRDQMPVQRLIVLHGNGPSSGIANAMRHLEMERGHILLLFGIRGNAIATMQVRLLTWRPTI